MPTSQEWVAQAEPDPTPDPTPAVETTADPVTPDPTPPDAPAAEPTAQEIANLEAWLDAEGGKKLSLPLTALIPRKVNGVEDRVPLSQVLKEHQFEVAWTQNNQRFAEQRKAFEASRSEMERDRRANELEKAAIAAERKALQDEVDQYRASLGDAEALARLVADQERLRNDPAYRKLHEDAIAHRMAEATRTRDSELQRFEESQGIAEEAADYISRTAAQYPGVDARRIQAYLATELQAGRLEIGPAPGQFNARTVDQLFQQEAARLKSIEDRAVSPLQEQLAALKAELDALKGKQNNQKVVAGLRAAPRSGGPPAPVTPGAKPKLDVNPDEDLSSRSQRWASLR